MSKCKSCNKKIEFGEKFSYSSEKIKKVCEECFDKLMEEKGYTVQVAPEGYKVYTFDDGVRYKQYIPRGPAYHMIPKKEELEIKEKVFIGVINRRLEATARRIEQKSE